MSATDKGRTTAAGGPVSGDADAGCGQPGGNWLWSAVHRVAQDGVSFLVRPITPHTFRHSYAVHLLMNGVHIKQVQALMGHKRLENTEVYTKIFALGVTSELAFALPVDEARELLALPITLEYPFFHR